MQKKDIAVISAGSGKLRKQIASRLKQNDNISFPQIIANSAEVSNYVRFGGSAIIMKRSTLRRNYTIKKA